MKDKTEIIPISNNVISTIEKIVEQNNMILEINQSIISALAVPLFKLKDDV